MFKETEEVWEAFYKLKGKTIAFNPTQEINKIRIQLISNHLDRIEEILEAIDKSLGLSEPL